MIILRDIALRRGSKLLLESADLTLQPGQRLALIGANGSGKSSLFALLIGELQADRGDILGLGGLRLAHMAQEIAASSLSAREFVWRGDTEVAKLRDNLTELENAGEFDKAASLHQQLEDRDGYSIERRATLLLQGLGFDDEVQERPVKAFSGGWRIRLNLARALMTPSDVLLLDEPTNHLDLDATLWLQQWLSQYPGTLLMISHDRDFIDATCERIVHIAHKSLSTYTGNYSDFEAQRAERLANQQASYVKQQRRMSEIDAFVRRFRYKASKAKQAQSRLKELERMQAIAPAHADSPFDFTFKPPEKSSDPLLKLEKATLGYGSEAILHNISVDLRPGTRYGLLGRNGAGKSTLLKTLIGELPLLAGTREAGEHLHIGYFDQQQLEALDLEASAALHVQRLSPQAREQDILNFLGGFNFGGDNATSPIAPMSGGEKARLALALIVWQRPNLLVLDEPTNHLDLEMRHALELALQAYEGALVLVSHDRHLLRNSVEELLLVDNGSVSEYGEDLAGYEKWLLAKLSNRAVSSEPGEKAPASKKIQRQQAAAARQKLKPARQRLQKAEDVVTQLEKKLAACQALLGDSDLYADARSDELSAILKEEGELKNEINRAEEEWLHAQEALDTLEEAPASEDNEPTVN